MRRALALSTFALTTLAQAQGLSLEISGANFRPMPVAVAAPIAQEGAPRAAVMEFDSALAFDFAASGLFQVLDRKSFLSDPKEGLTAGSINFSRWADVGAEALIKTQLTAEGEQLRADLRVFTVATGREELKASHQLPARDARRLAHVLANAVYKQFTRESGPFESKLAYVRKAAGGRDVIVSDWDGKNAQPLATGGMNLLPAFHPDGMTVAFTSYRRGTPDLFAQRLGGAATPVIRSGKMVTGVDYSPDGRRIAFAMAEGESTQIYVASADGSNVRQLTSTPFFLNTSPSWSPDGKRLAFVSNRGGSPQIYVMNAEGGEPKRLTFQGNYNQTPDWSPRGDLIAFTARDERNVFDIFTVSVETGKISRITQDQGNNEEPCFSPNGRLLIFTSTRNGWPQLFVSTFDGNNQLPLPVEKGAYLTPTWSR